MAPTSWIVLAFVTAVVMMVIAAMSSASSRRGVRQFLADLHAVDRQPETDGIGQQPAGRNELVQAAHEDDEGGVADLFQIGEVPDSAYVDPTPFAEPIVRMTRTLRDLVRS